MAAPNTYRFNLIGYRLGNLIEIGVQLVIWVALILLFNNHLVSPPNALVFLVIIPMILLAYILNLFFSIIMGLLAFWTQEVDGLFYAFRIGIKFLSGAYFPSDVARWGEEKI